jgi:hypothetical protein
MGRSLVLHAARRWRTLPAAKGRRLKVTVVDRAADANVASLLERLPGLAAVCDILPHTMELDSAEFERADFLFGARRTCDVTGVYVCLGDDALGLGAALRLRSRLGGRKVPIAVRTTQQGGVASLLGVRSDRGAGGDGVFRDLEMFGLFDLVCRPDVLLGGQNEVLARAIHEAYVRGERAKGRTPADNPSMVEWDLLSESLRDSNRGQAADIRSKLQAIGRDLAPLVDWDAPLIEFTPDEVEKLARMEHDRWCRERRAGGWRYAPLKDVIRKESPYLVDFDGLPEEVQEIDRAAIRGIPAFLAEVDNTIVRVESPSAPGMHPKG